MPLPCNPKLISHPASPTVLLTGASGFLAAHVGQQLLERGYKVRGTVRSKAKGEYLDTLYADKGVGERWSWVVVEDIEAVGSLIVQCRDNKVDEKGLLS